MASVLCSAPEASAGTSSGEISQARMAASVARTRLVELLRRDRPADQILDQSLRHAGIDGIMGHLIADAIGAPAEREFGKIAGAEHQGLMHIGETEEIVGAQARLNILEGHVIELLALGEGMFDVGEHLPRRRLDVELVTCDGERLHQGERIGLGDRDSSQSPAW